MIAEEFQIDAEEIDVLSTRDRFIIGAIGCLILLAAARGVLCAVSSLLA